MSDQEPPNKATVHHIRAASSGRKQPRMVQTTLDMFQKTPEEDAQERHDKFTELMAKFLQANNLPPSVIDNRSFDVLMETLAQCGPDYVFPTQEELEGPLFEKEMNRMAEVRKKHEKAWVSHGCTLMVDSWTHPWKSLHLLRFMVGSVEGVFFLGSADASYASDHTDLLAELIEERIEAIGRDKVVQVVTDNSHNLKAACTILVGKIPILFWTPCAFQCLDHMLKDIGKLEEFKKHIQQAKRVTTFIYRHVTFLYAMCKKMGEKDLVVPATTRYSTPFLTLERIYKHRDVMKCLFTNEDWGRSNLSGTQEGRNLCQIVLSTTFWNGVEDCIKASEPLLVLLRMVYDADRPAMPEVLTGLDLAKKKMRDSFASNPGVLKKLMDIVERRWADQREQKLYGAALFLNPNKFFDIKENDPSYASSLRSMFNDVIEKMIVDNDDLMAKVIDQADQYESTESSFGKLPTLQRNKKNPYDWWSAYSQSARELQKFAWRIVGLYCSASGYDRNWTMFDCIHTITMKQSDRKRLEDMAYLRHNIMIADRSERQQLEGSKFEPLVLEGYEFDHEWVGKQTAQLYNRDNLAWQLVEEVTRGSYTLEHHYCPMIRSEHRSFTPSLTGDTSSGSDVDDESFVVDDDGVEDDYGLQDPPTAGKGSSGPSGNKAPTGDPYDSNDDF